MRNSRKKSYCAAEEAISARFGVIVAKAAALLGKLATNPSGILWAPWGLPASHLK
jgi:hypothetical protein